MGPIRGGGESLAVHGRTVLAAVEAGTVSVNTPAVIGIEMPFGGYKQSGYGRELGVEGLDAYLQHKSVVMDIG